MIVAGLKPPLVTPVGKPDALPTLRSTVPVNPPSEPTVTTNVVDWPGTIVCEAGLTLIQKSGAGPRTQMVRVGGLGSVLPAASRTVSEATYVPGVSNVTLPGFCTVAVAGVPPGNTQEYPAATVSVANVTVSPALTHRSAAGAVITPRGGVVV